MSPSRIAVQDDSCIPTTWSAEASTAIASDAAGIGSVTMRVTGRSKVRVVPRWSVTVIAPDPVPGPEASGRSAQAARRPRPPSSAAPRRTSRREIAGGSPAPAHASSPSGPACAASLTMRRWRPV